jgi:hypothetical protein
MYGPRYGLAIREAPLVLPRFQICAIASKAAMMDAGVAWLYGLLQDTAMLEPAQLEAADGSGGELH